MTPDPRLDPPEERRVAYTLEVTVRGPACAVRVHADGEPEGRAFDSLALAFDHIRRHALPPRRGSLK